MKPRRILAASALAALLLALPTQAHAEGPARSRGLDFTLGLGAAGCTDSACSGFDMSAAVRTEVLFRFIPYLAAGAHVGFLFADPDRNSPNYYDLGWTAMIGGEVRGILPVGPLEAWLGFAMGWMHMQVNQENDRDNEVDEYWANGLGIGFGFGAQYFIVRQFALGLDFWLYKGVFNRACTYENDGPADTETCWDLDDDEQAGIGVSFTFGLTATFFLSL